MSSVQSVERAFSVLRCLASGPAGVSEVAERSHLPKSTVSRLLSTLNELGAVDQLGAGGDYRIGDLLVELAAAAQPGRSLVAIARPHLVQLREALGEATGLSVLDGHDVLYLDHVEADHPVQVRDWTGERLPAHLVSSGFVLLAGAPRGRARRVPRRHAATGDGEDDDRSRADPAARRRRSAAGERDGSTKSSSKASTRWPHPSATWATGSSRPSTPMGRRSASPGPVAPRRSPSRSRPPRIGSAFVSPDTSSSSRP